MQLGRLRDRDESEIESESEGEGEEMEDIEKAGLREGVKGMQIRQ